MTSYESIILISIAAACDLPKRLLTKDEMKLLKNTLERIKIGNYFEKSEEAQLVVFDAVQKVFWASKDILQLIP